MRNTHLCLLLLATLTASMSQACAPTITASYSVENVSTASWERSMDVVVNINRFIDKRRSLPINHLSFAGDKKAVEGRKEWCVNAESTYSGGDVPGQIAAQIARHVRKRGNYRGVTHGNFSGADYYLGGDLAAFHGRQEVSIQHAVGVGVGGLVGAAIAGTATSHAEIIIAFDNLQVYDGSGRKVQDLEPVYGRFEEELTADYDCWAIFGNVNEKLKNVVSRLADQLDTGIWKALKQGARGSGRRR